MTKELKGILFMVLAGFWASILIALVRGLSQDFHVFFIIMMRNFFGFVFFLPRIFHNYQKILVTKNIKIHFFRSINGIISMAMWFYSIAIIDLSEGVAISFIVPILTTIAAIVIFKEKLQKYSILSLIIGFIGILIILRPGFREVLPAHFYCLAAASLWMVSNILIKIMVKSDSPKTIVFYMSFFMMIFAIPFAFPHMRALSFYEIFLFASLGLVANLTHEAISKAYQNAKLSDVQPFDFTRLIFTAIISYVIFGQIIDIWVIIGSLVILFGVILVLPKKRAVIEIDE